MKQTGKIKIDDLFHIDFDRFGMRLVKKTPTGRTNYIKGSDVYETDEWHYGSNLKLLLSRYLNEAVKIEGSVNDILEKLDKIENNINKLELNK